MELIDKQKLIKNEYEIRGEITAIFLDSPKFGRQEALVSTSKLPRLLRFPAKWYAHYNKYTDSFYVEAHTPGTNRKMTKLHRFLTDCPLDKVVDHINHDTLNNTDENLRVVSRSTNQRNTKRLNFRNKTGITGVYFHKRSGKWAAQYKVKGRAVHVGLFETPQAAAEALASRKAQEMIV